MYPLRGYIGIILYTLIYSDFTENLHNIKKMFGTLLARQSSVNALIDNRIL